jgi:hypothetical protein
MLNDLPESVREIAEVIGREDALRLVGQLPTCYAGNDGKKSNRVIMYVPKRLAPDHKLVEILGWNVAMKLVRHFGGEILQPANCNHLKARLRNRRILEMLGEGVPDSFVADEMEVTVRYVRYLRHMENPQEEKPHIDAKNPC